MSAFLFTLALHHAPMVFQQTGHTPKADTLTRFDFDGDYIANNNWQNLKSYPTPSHVYYEVFETVTHYFLFYAFFHARDYATVCMKYVCHEDDLEGALFVVRKDEGFGGGYGGGYGTVEIVQTLAHNKIFTYKKPTYVPVNPAKDISHRSERIALFIEAGGHGVFSYDSQKREKIEADSFGRKPEKDEHILSKKFINYEPGLRADVGNGSSEGQLTYSLLNIRDEFWSRRNDLGKGRMFSETYEFGGSRIKLGEIPKAFAGEKWTGGRANPPWAWLDDSRSDVKRGDWYMDPAFFVAKTLVGVRHSKISLEYLVHPYL